MGGVGGLVPDVRAELVAGVGDGAEHAAVPVVEGVGDWGCAKYDVLAVDGAGEFLGVGVGPEVGVVVFEGVGCAFLVGGCGCDGEGVEVVGGERDADGAQYGLAVFFGDF